MGVPLFRVHPVAMAPDTQLSITARYLRFPLVEDHRTRLQDGSACPHCRSRHVQKWGTFRGRQRYRCSECRRTFSTFTGTALYYLKHPERWRRFLWCHDGRLTVRHSGAVLGVGKDTALRWRHRLLDQWRRDPRRRLRGRVVVGDFCMPQSAKGVPARSLHRPPRRRGADWIFASLSRNSLQPVTLLAALETPAGLLESPAPLLLQCVGVRRVRPADYDQRIAPRIRELTEIVGRQGPMSPLASFARRLGVPYRPERRGFLPREVFVVRRELRAWLRPFRGVSTRRLDNYLEWFRRHGGRRDPPPRRSQQFPWTEPYRSRSTAGGGRSQPFLQPAHPG